jgi:hypothetical protein
MVADAFIHCRVTPEQKALVRRLAEHEGINESTLVKQFLEVVLRTSALAGLPSPPAPGKVNRDARLYIRLAPEDLILLKERATARGMASATYVSLLVRSHLRDIAPLPKVEYLALKESIVELAAIGRNLNQIARALHQGGRPALPGRSEAVLMLKIAVTLRDQFKALLSANERSWRQGHAQL